MQSVRIIEIPDCKMVSSGPGFFGQENFTHFEEWFSALPTTIYSRDYLYHDGTSFCWLYLYSEGMTVPEEFSIVDFKGGYYAVTTDIDGQTDVVAMNAAVDAFLQKNGLVRDASRFDLGNVITPPSVQKVLGYCQMDYFTPVKPKSHV